MSFNFAALTNLFGNKFNTSTLLSTFGSYMLNGGSSGSASIFGYSNSNQNYGMQTNQFGYYTNYNQYGQARADQGFQNFLSIVSMFMPGIGSFFSNLVSGIVNDKLNNQLSQLGSENRSSVVDAKQKEALKKDQSGLENNIAENNAKLNLLKNENLKNIAEGKQYNDIQADSSNLQNFQLNTSKLSPVFGGLSDYIGDLPTEIPAFEKKDFDECTNFQELNEELDNIINQRQELNDFLDQVNELCIEESEVDIEGYDNIEDLDNQLQEANENVTLWEESANNKQEEIDKKQNDIGNIQNEIDQNTQAISVYDNRITDNTNRKNEIDSKIPATEQEMTSLKDKLNNLNEDDDNYKLQKFEIESQIANLEQQLNDLKTEKQKLDEENEKLEKQKSELKGKNEILEGQKCDLEEAKTELEQDKTDIETQLEDLRITQTDLQQAKEQATQKVTDLQQQLDKKKGEYKDKVNTELAALDAYEEKLKAIVMNMPEGSQDKFGNEMTFGQLLENQGNETYDAEQLFNQIKGNDGEIDTAKRDALIKKLTDSNNTNADRLKLINFMTGGLGNNSGISGQQAMQLMQQATELYNNGGTFEQLMNFAARLSIPLNTESGQTTATDGIDKATFINQMSGEYSEVGVTNWVNNNVSGNTVTSDDAQRMKQDAGTKINDFKIRPRFGKLDDTESIIKEFAAKDKYGFSQHIDSDEAAQIRNELSKLKKNNKNSNAA